MWSGRSPSASAHRGPEGHLSGTGGGVSRRSRRRRRLLVLMWATAVLAIGPSSAYVQAQVPLRDGLEILAIDARKHPRVRLAVSISPDLAAIHGSEEPSFIVEENSQARQATARAAGGEDRAVVMVFDGVPGSGEQGLARVRSAAAQFLRQMDDATEVGLIATDRGRVIVEQELTTDHRKLNAVLASIEPIGRPVTLDALGRAAELLDDSTRASRGVVLLTFEVASAGTRTPDGVVEALRDQGVNVQAVALAAARGSALLQGVVGAAGGHVWEVESPASVAEAYDRIAVLWRHQFLIAYSSRVTGSTDVVVRANSLVGQLTASRRVGFPDELRASLTPRADEQHDAARDQVGVAGPTAQGEPRDRGATQSPVTPLAPMLLLLFVSLGVGALLITRRVRAAGGSEASVILTDPQVEGATRPSLEDAAGAELRRDPRWTSTPAEKRTSIRPRTQVVSAPAEAETGRLIPMRVPLVMVALAEALGALAAGIPGLALHALVLPVLLVAAGKAERPLHRTAGSAHAALLALAVIPVVRLSAFSVRFTGSKATTLLAVSALAGLSLLLVQYAVRLPRADWGLMAPDHRQFAIAMSGLPLGGLALALGLGATVGHLERNMTALVLTLPAAAFLEELLYRGLIQSTLTARLGTRAWLVSVVLYSVSLAGTLSLPSAFVYTAMAMYFAWCRHITGSIVGVAVAHAVVNLILV